MLLAGNGVSVMGIPDTGILETSISNTAHPSLMLMLHCPAIELNDLSGQMFAAIGHRWDPGRTCRHN
jgi:hypothetical protein